MEKAVYSDRKLKGGCRDGRIRNQWGKNTLAEMAIRGLGHAAGIAGVIRGKENDMYWKKIIKNPEGEGTQRDQTGDIGTKGASMKRRKLERSTRVNSVFSEKSTLQNSRKGVLE